MNLSEALEPHRTSELEFILPISEDWLQGRGAFGGLVIGGLIRAIEMCEPETDRVLRSLTSEVAAPVVPGTARIIVTPLRRGTGATTLRASIVSGQEVLADAVAVLGRPRPGGPNWQRLSPPSMPRWQDVPMAPIRAPLGPVFTAQFEYRSSGPPPFMGAGAEPVAGGWIRPIDPGPRRHAASLAACIDAWWPASATVFEAVRPLGTVTFTLEILGKTEGLDPASPYMYSGRAPVAVDGYTMEFRELWGEDGRLLALNQQTITIIK